MNIRLSFLPILLLLITIKVQSQTLFTPLELAKKIFAKTEFEPIKIYSTGDFGGYYKCHPTGQDIAKDARLQFSLLNQTETKAVVVMTILDKTGRGIDTYLHFKKERIWKLSSFRNLAMTEAIHGAIAEMENMTTQKIDSVIDISQKDTTGNATFKSKEDFDFELANMKLTVSLDSEIVAHFIKNKLEFERLKSIVFENIHIDTDGERFIADKAFIKDYRKLLISSVRLNDYELGKGVSFTIGGILDNTVGYLYIRDKKDIPEMDPDKIIMLREIGNGWYLYKTT